MYKIEKIGPLVEKPYQNSTELTGINNHGQVVGYCYSQFLQYSYGFIWQTGNIHTLSPFSGKYCRALSINDRSDIVGEAQSQYMVTVFGDSSEDLQEHFWPALWAGYRDGYLPIEIPYRLASPNEGRAIAINNNREVIGADLPELWRRGPEKQMCRVPLALPKLAPQEDFDLLNLNNQGTILGCSYEFPRNWMGSDAPLPKCQNRPWLYQKGNWQRLALPQDATGRAKALNDVGVSVGSVALAKTARRPYLWENGKGQFLGEQEGEARAINNKGSIVGSFRTGKRTVACLWKDGKPLSLETLLPPSSGWILYDAVGINDKGQIIGHGAFRGAGVCGYLLTPTP